MSLTPVHILGLSKFYSHYLHIFLSFYRNHNILQLDANFQVMQYRYVLKDLKYSI
jgi:hypothetical protein